MSEEQPSVAEPIPEPVVEPVEELRHGLESRDIDRLEVMIRSLTSGDLARAVSQIEPPQRRELLELMPPETSAYVLDQLAHAQAADLLEDLPTETAAAIIDQLPSDEQADLLGAFSEKMRRRSSSRWRRKRRRMRAC